MIVTTLGASSSLAGRAGVYVVKDGARVLYVGQSKDVARRLAQHKRAASSFGQAIRDTSGSDGWRVTLLDIGECSKISGQVCRDLDDAEKAIIKELSPAYNTQYNGGRVQPSCALPDNIKLAILAIGRSRAWMN